MRRDRYSQARPSEKINSKIKTEPLLLEVSQVTVEAGQKPKEEMFSFTLGALPDVTLNRLLDSMAPTARSDEAANAALVLLMVFLRGHLHGDARGGFEASDEEFGDILHTLEPYLVIELIRRRGCFELFELPESPWAFGASIRVHGPHREDIEGTIAELKRRRLPYPPVLSDARMLQQMEGDGVGIEMPMPVRGRSVVTPQTLNLQPHKALALDPEAFIAAFKEVNEYALSTDPATALETPDGVPSEVDFVEDGKVQRWNLDEMRSSPQGRIVKIMHKYFGQSFEEDRSALLRFHALMDLLRKDALSDWITGPPDSPSMHPAILVTAATMKLTKGGLFPPARFVREVEELAKQA
jgi:hypothetical protein